MLLSLLVRSLFSFCWFGFSNIMFALLFLVLSLARCSLSPLSFHFLSETWRRIGFWSLVWINEVK